jgi:predicted nucleotidyltransferase
MENKREMGGERRVLEYLLDCPTKGVSQVEIRQALKLPASSVSVILERLVNKFSWIADERVGNTYQYKVDLANPVARQYKKLRTVERLWPMIKELEEISRRVILFGSAREGKNTEEGDVDLLVETGDKGAAREIVGKFKNLPVEIVMKTAEEMSRLRQEDGVFYDEVFDRGEVLWKRE